MRKRTRPATPGHHGGMPYRTKKLSRTARYFSVNPGHNRSRMTAGAFGKTFTGNLRGGDLPPHMKMESSSGENMEVREL